MSQIGSVELFLPYGGSIQFLPGGELMLARDDDGTGLATQQRIERILQSHPTVKDDSGNPIGRPTDLCNPDQGAGLTTSIGENFDPNDPNDPVIVEARRNILYSLRDDPGLDQAYTPVLTVQPSDPSQPGKIIATLTVRLTSGQVYTFPSVLGG